MDIGFSTNYNNINIYDYSVLQVTLGDPSNPTYENINYELYKNKKTKIFVHTKFTYNISKKNINYSIKEEINFLKNINQFNTGVVIHLSKHYEKNNEEGLKDVANKLNELCEKYLKNTSLYILLENSYNLEHLGCTIEDFYFIYENLNDLSKIHIKFCLDTSHLFLSGQPINNSNFLIEYLSLFEQKIGLDKIKLIHLNDIDSIPFGRHTPHLSILDKNGKIFYNNYVCLDLIISLSKIYKIPLILERKFSSNIQTTLINIEKEIKFIKLYNNLSIDFFKIIIKNIIFLNFINLLIDFNEINFKKDNVENLKKLKHKIIESYNEKNKQYYYSNKIKLDIKPYIEKLISEKEFKEYYEDLYNILNNYNYDIFKKYLNNEKYKTIKNLLELKFLGIESAIKLYQNQITSLEDLLNLPNKTKKNYLNNIQYKALQNYKFLKNNITYEVALNIEETIKQNLPNNINFNIYGSYYRNKEKLDYFKTYKDLDGLLVVKKENDIKIFLEEIYKIFLLKCVLIDGEKKKYIILKHNNKKNYYFILDLYICNPDEEVYMFVYLTNTVYKNILLRKIAKTKNYTLSNTSLFDHKNNKYIFLNSAQELYSLLNIN